MYWANPRALFVLGTMEICTHTTQNQQNQHNVHLHQKVDQQLPCSPFVLCTMEEMSWPSMWSKSRDLWMSEQEEYCNDGWMFLNKHPTMMCLAKNFKKSHNNNNRWIWFEQGFFLLLHQCHHLGTASWSGLHTEEHACEKKKRHSSPWAEHQCTWATSPPVHDPTHGKPPLSSLSEPAAPSSSQHLQQEQWHKVKYTQKGSNPHKSHHAPPDS